MQNQLELVLKFSILCDTYKRRKKQNWLASKSLSLVSRGLEIWALRLKSERCHINQELKRYTLRKDPNVSVLIELLWWHYCNKPFIMWSNWSKPKQFQILIVFLKGTSTVETVYHSIHLASKVHVSTVDDTAVLSAIGSVDHITYIMFK